MGGSITPDRLGLKAPVKKRRNPPNPSRMSKAKWREQRLARDRYTAEYDEQRGKGSDKLREAKASGRGNLMSVARKLGNG